LVLQKRFQVTKVKIAISCCTHSFFTQLTSSPCIRRSKKRIKNRKTDKKTAAQRFVWRNAAKKVDCKNTHLPFPVVVVVVDVVKCSVELDRCDRFEILV